MEDRNNKINDEELERAVGGVSVDEMKALKPGTKLIYSEFLKGDMCELEYLGYYIDPGFGYYYQLRCVVTKLLVEDREKLCVIGRYISSPINGTTVIEVKVGQEIYVARNDVRVK